MALPNPMAGAIDSYRAKQIAPMGSAQTGITKRTTPVRGYQKAGFKGVGPVKKTATMY